MRMFSERYSSPSTSDAQSQQHGFICMSTTVDELSYTPSQEEKTRDAEQVVATGRKSWKTLRGKGEAVWPPLLEAALIEALEKYQQETIGSTKVQKSGRFPMRNRFVSDYIYESTGKSRTPKQVGSRLQQLRDTCKGDKIIQLISRITPECQPTESQSDCSSRASITPPPDEPSPMSTSINVQISLQKVLRHCPVPVVRFVANNPMNPYIINLSPRSHVDHKIRTSTSSNLFYLSGTVEFPSPCALALQSTFIVYLDDSHTPLHSEIAPLKCLSSAMKQSGWLYSSEIAPDFWDTLCSSPDLTRYTILQSLKPMPAVHFESNPATDSSRASPTVFITYKFSYQEPCLQTSFNTVAPNPSVYPASYPVSTSSHNQVNRPSNLSVYPASYPASTSSHNQSVTMDINHPQWRVPSEDADTKYQLPLPSELTSYFVPTLSDRSVQAAYNSQPPPVPIQRHDYVVVNSHPQLNYYYSANSTSSSGSSWTNERDSGQGQYWPHRN